MSDDFHKWAKDAGNKLRAIGDHAENKIPIENA
jgi:hypothetical protein